MKIRVLFFGATVAAIGARELEAVIDEAASPAHVISQLRSQHPTLGLHKLLFAVNEEYVDETTRLSEGDQLAIFTAVSGG